MTDDFSYIDLNALQNGPLLSDQGARAAFESSTGIKILVLPYRNLAHEWTQNNRFKQLNTLISNNLEDNPFHSSGWEPKAKTYLRFTDCDSTKIHQLCEALVRPRNIMDDCLVFLHGAAFRRLHNMEEFSAFAAPSFLLRNDGALRCDTTGQWKDQIDQSEAWLGAGWFINTQRSLCPNPSRKCHGQCQDFSGQCYERLGQRIDNECKALCERHLLAGINNPAGRPSVAEIEIKRRQIALLLTAYLPRFTQTPDCPVWQPYGADAITGRRPLRGPVPWNGWSDQRMVPLEQDLLFEGWLTPFVDTEGNWTLQPASLTLLFWAARVMDLPFTKDPHTFINHHDWRGWFGKRCRWQREQPPTGATG